MTSLGIAIQGRAREALQLLEESVATLKRRQPPQVRLGTRAVCAKLLCGGVFLQRPARLTYAVNERNLMCVVSKDEEICTRYLNTFKDEEAHRSKRNS